MTFIKRLFALFCAAFMVISADVSVSAEQRVKRASPESLVILGDSIASGYGLDGYESGNCYSSENYGSMLAEKYKIKSEGYKNFAVDGQTSAELSEKIRNGSYDEFLDAELVVISIGGNDLLSVLIGKSSVIYEQTGLEDFLNGEIGLAEAIGNVNLVELTSQMIAEADLKIAEFKANMPEILKQIKQKNPDAQIVLQTLYNPMNTGIELIDTLYGNAISKLNSAIFEMTDCVVCDVEAEFSQSEENLIQSDYTHPNASGHKVIFEAVSQTVNEKCEFYDTIKTLSEPDSYKNSDTNVFVILICLLSTAAFISAVAAFVIKNRKKQP